MKRLLAAVAGLVIALGVSAQVPRLDELLKGSGIAPGASVGASDDKTNAAGIREALAVGTERAVKNLAQVDGYFGNEAVKILVPPSIRKVTDVARMAGFQKQVDEFTLSMNRAAEAAAPLAARHFADAIRAMTLEDVRSILTGGDTAATEFFRRKTNDTLYAAFKPVVAQKVGEVGATRAYRDMMGRYESTPLVSKQSLDLDDFVTRKALDGLFVMIGEEERRIRSNPAARTTELLKAVFGR